MNRTRALPELTNVVPLPPLVAQAALDAVLAELPGTSRAGERRLRVDGGRMSLGVGPAAPERSGWAFQTIGGRLQVSGWRPSIPLLLKLVPRSGQQTGLVVCTRRELCVGISEEAYFRVGWAVLKRLTRLVQTWPCRESRELERRFGRMAAEMTIESRGGVIG